MSSSDSTTTTTEDQQKQNVTATVNGALNVSANVTALLKMAPIDYIKAIPNLTTYQATTKTHAETWDPIYEKIVSVATDIISYGEYFDAAYNQLVSLNDTLLSSTATDSEKESAKSTFIQVLNEGLLPELEKKKSAAGDVKDQVKAFVGNFEVDSANFDQAIKDARKAYETDEDSKIPELNTEIATLKVKAQNLLFGILGTTGSFVTGAGVAVMMAPEAAPAIIIGLSIVTVIVDSTLLGVYVSTMKDLSKKMSELSNVEAEAAQLEAISTVLDNYKTAIDNIADSANSVYEGWVTLYKEMSTMISDAQTMDPETVASVLINIRLTTMNSEWGDIVATTNKLLPDGEVPVTDYDSLDAYADDQATKVES